MRELRRDSIVSAQERAEPRLVDYRLLLGAAYTDAERGERRWATPFVPRTLQRPQDLLQALGRRLRGVDPAC